MNPNITSIIKAAEKMEVPVKLALWSRCRFLKSELRKSADLIDSYLTYGDDVAVYMAKHENETVFLPLARELRETTLAMRGEERPAHKDAITDDMIQKAREYPIDNVVDFSRGLALAFCHPDKRPSLNHHKKANRAHCFPCGKSFDPIAVLMQRDGMSFADAVRRLAA